MRHCSSLTVLCVYWCNTVTESKCYFFVWNCVKQFLSLFRHKCTLHLRQRTYPREWQLLFLQRCRLAVHSGRCPQPSRPTGLFNNFCCTPPLKTSPVGKKKLCIIYDTYGPGTIPCITLLLFLSGHFYADSPFF